MGCFVSSDPQALPSSHHRQDIQRQLDLQYSKKIFQFIIDTLYVIAHKFQPEKYVLHKQLHSGIDCSSKNLSQLKFQLKLSILLFELSKKKIEQEQNRKYPLTLTINRDKIDQYLFFFLSKDEEVSEICKKITQIILGNYSQQVQTMQTILIQQKSELKLPKLVSQGIKATLMKEEIQNNLNQLLQLKQSETLGRTNLGQTITV